MNDGCNQGALWSLVPKEICGILFHALLPVILYEPNFQSVFEVKIEFVSIIFNISIMFYAYCVIGDNFSIVFFNYQDNFWS